MSSESLTSIFWRTESADRQPSRRDRIFASLAFLGPSQTWMTLALLLICMLIVGESITSAAWVDTPGLPLVIMASVASAALLAHARSWGFARFLAGVLLAPLFVVWAALGLVREQVGLIAKLGIMVDRCSLWWEAALNDGISTDVMPFALLLLSSAWMMGYIGSWFVFRFNNAWIAVVLSGTALLTNLSFLPERFGSRFFLFTFFAMLLIVWVNSMRRQQRLKEYGTHYDSSGSWLMLHSVAWMSIFVLILAAMLPMRVWVVQTFAETWASARSPVDGLEEHFARLLSGVPSHMNANGRLFGSSLPFLGAISFGGEVVFWAESDYPSYWLSRTYSEYTSQGWKAGGTTPVEIGPNIVPLPLGDSLQREPIEQTLQLDFDTSSFLAGGNVDWVSHSAEVGTLAPKTFRMDMTSDEGDALLPTDLQETAQTLRSMMSQPLGELVESEITDELPDDVVLTALETRADSVLGTTTVTSVAVTRKEPIFPDVVSFRFENTLPANNVVSLRSYVSIATDDELREAGTNYDSFITDHYMQLPPTLPQRVRELALELTEDAETPFDKAMAIQEYMRSEEFTYSQDIEAPPAQADGVDHFLFETQTGYSDYFGSSMAVLLRAAGVPARMAAGFAPGEYVPVEGKWAVRDSDSHGWVQAYFPRYGWIDFEPTPSWAPHERRILDTPAPGGLPDRITGASETEEGFFAFPIEDEDAFLNGFGGETVAPTTNYMGIVVRAGIAVGTLAAIWLVFYTVWNMALVNASPVERAFTKMTRLGAFAGVPKQSHHTPDEYGRLLAASVPESADRINDIASAYSGLRYSGKIEISRDEDRFERFWKSIRSRLIVHGIRRFLPFLGV